MKVALEVEFATAVPVNGVGTLYALDSHLFFMEVQRVACQFNARFPQLKSLVIRKEK